MPENAGGHDRAPGSPRTTKIYDGADNEITLKL
jgi:hypothetical protein